MDNPPHNFEEYARALSETMANAVAAAEALQAEAEADREAAHDDEDALRDLLHDLDTEAQRAAEDELPALRARIKQEMKDTLMKRLKQYGWDESKIIALLEGDR